MANQFSRTAESTNCQACGAEHFVGELRTVKLSGTIRPIEICEVCLESSPEESFKKAAEILNDIMKIVKSDRSDPEGRLNQIKKMILG